MIGIAIFALLFGLSAAGTFEDMVQSKENADMSKNWAVLLTGTKDYDNYHDQADISHAYQVLIRRGFHPDKIITMMYDNIATHVENPFPDELYNNYSHINVYDGVKVDYRTVMVHSKNFLLMMKGDQGLKQKGFKVLESTEEDTIFLNIVDNGSNGMLYFPVRDYLEASQLQDLITEMSDKKRFKQMLIYVQSQKAGSMFSNYNFPTNVYAITSTNTEEISYNCYCEDPAFYVCLGTCFSVNWMYDTETHSTTDRTVEQQYESVKKATNLSHVTTYGDQEISKKFLSEFQGTTTSEKPEKRIRVSEPDHVEANKAHLMRHYQVIKRSNDLVAVRKAKQHIKLDEMRNAQAAQVVDWIIEESMGKLTEAANNKMTKQVNTNTDFPEPRNYGSCYKDLVIEFTDCFRMNKVPMSAEHHYKLRNLCKLRAEIKQSSEELKAIVTDACDFKFALLS
ncbi:hypothetical protein Ciccas_003631 [Cichlidogyrus casuarinus]|uniref:Legumain n=1 Tax=Cichlidogyrus casuarinus TaxID=1844966 RepID=A0ABD2QDV4_9PLAT